MAKKKEAKKKMKGFFREDQFKEDGNLHKKQTAERRKYLASCGHYQELLKSMGSTRLALDGYYKKEKDSPLDKSSDVPEIKRFQKKFRKESVALLRSLAKSM